MEGLIVIGVILGIWLYTFLLVLFIYKYYNKQAAKTQDKISDAEILQLVYRANHFLTADQLASVSPLTKKESKTRLTQLSMQKALRRLHGNTGFNVYQLQQDVPLSPPQEVDLEKLSEQEIVSIILDQVQDYQVTPAQLSVIFGLDIKSARKLLKRLRTHGLVTINYTKGFQRIYVIKQPLNANPPKLKNLIAAPILKDLERIKIPDADVLDIAIQNKGRITPSVLCVAKRIPLEEAKIKLDKLYEQGAFHIDVDEKEGTIAYLLRDSKLYK
ncbi:MAG: hypothetical protein GY810_10810 [Aureispira sp.]|nr:hypothetical protein [Aureispira sp.]